MTVVVPAERRHAASLAELLTELARFYGDTPPPRDAQAHGIAAALFGDPPVAYALVAVDGRTVVGFAAYSFLWPASGVSHSLYLKELYVLAARRKAGVGRLLMDAVFAVAARHGCSRVEWTTDGPNADAQQFYRLLGHEPRGGKVHYRVTLDR